MRVATPSIVRVIVDAVTTSTDRLPSFDPS